MLLGVSLPAVAADTIPSGFSRPVEWRIGAEVALEGVPGTDRFLKGNNPEEKRINTTFAADLRAGFSFNPATRQGMLYRGLYQGVGVSYNTYFAPSLLGTPVSVYAYQGAPIVHLSPRLWLGYEWQFGAAFGWKHYSEFGSPANAAVSTAVTAHMGMGLKLHYSLSDNLQLAVGVGGRHFSNGNTSWPNGGVNSIGATIGVAYILNPQTGAQARDKALEAEADRHGWFYDIVAYGAARKRIIKLREWMEPQLCPGRFGVVGLQFSPMYRLNRWVAVGPALDAQWDEGAGLPPYWVDDTFLDNIQFRRPPFGKQLNVGVSAHAELTMPIFSVNCGLGYDFINPVGNKAFYQSLTLKTFLTKNIFLNVGYRLSEFNIPQNLVLGLGLRL